MATYQYNDLVTIAQQNGFNAITARIIAAIAMAESGGNTQITNQNTDGTIDRGVLQLNSYWHSEVSDTCAFDVQCSFQQAYRISGGTDFSQWVTYKTGAYKTFLTPTTIRPGVGGSGFPLPTLPSAINGLEPAQNFIASLSTTPLWGWLTQPMRILKIVVGIALVLVALYEVVSNNPVVAQTVKKVGETIGET